MFAGFHSVGTSLFWAIDAIGRDPAIHEKLISEINANV
jgi:hypothetical protein